MHIKSFTLAILLCGIACANSSDGNPEQVSAPPADTVAFDKAKWKIKEDHDYPYRDLMLGALMAGDTLKKMEKESVLELLGLPDRTDNNYLFYRITQTRLGVWPLHTKTLVIKFSEDGPVDWVRIHE